jgi:hypothetical protein
MGYTEPQNISHELFRELVATGKTHTNNGGVDFNGKPPSIDLLDEDRPVEVVHSIPRKSTVIEWKVTGHSNTFYTGIMRDEFEKFVRNKTLKKILG